MAIKHTKKNKRGVRSFTKHRRELMKDPAFKREYDRLAYWYELTKRLIQIRHNEGLTQKELAERLGTKQAAISRFERGESNPSLDFLRRLADGLGVELDIKVRERK